MAVVCLPVASGGIWAARDLGGVTARPAYSILFALALRSRPMTARSEPGSRWAALASLVMLPGLALRSTPAAAALGSRG